MGGGAFKIASKFPISVTTFNAKHQQFQLQKSPLNKPQATATSWPDVDSSKSRSYE